MHRWGKKAEELARKSDGGNQDSSGWKGDVTRFFDIVRFRDRGEQDSSGQVNDVMRPLKIYVRRVVEISSRARDDSAIGGGYGEVAGFHGEAAGYEVRVWAEEDRLPDIELEEDWGDKTLKAMGITPPARLHETPDVDRKGVERSPEHFNAEPETSADHGLPPVNKDASSGESGGESTRDINNIRFPLSLEANSGRKTTFETIFGPSEINLQEKTSKSGFRRKLREVVNKYWAGG